MTAFDLIVLGVVGVSAILAFWRGLIRVVVSLAAWVFGLMAAIHFSDRVGALLPDIAGRPAVRYFVAFAVIFIAAFVVGTAFGFVLSQLARAVGLGFVDRSLGAVFGAARGLLIVLVLVLVAGLTALPREKWWQNAWLSPPLTVAALSLRPWLPKALAGRLDYGNPERRVPKVAEARTGA